MSERPAHTAPAKPAPDKLAAQQRPALVLTDVRRSFSQAGSELDVLRGASFSVFPGQLVALVGPSGAGKSTLLHIAGLLEPPSAGTVSIMGEDATQLSDAKRTRLRAQQIGFVYQFHHLLPEFSALENVMIPQMIAGLSKAVARKRARELLHMVGLSARETHRPARLSGGEQQRVAVARALANAPAILLADEPTGNLDPRTAGGVFDMLRALVRGVGLAAVVATHNLDMARRMDRVLVLRSGLVEEARLAQ